jgi:hypothetical protein
MMQVMLAVTANYKIGGDFAKLFVTNKSIAIMMSLAFHFNF